FNDTATTEIYTLSLHDALPISLRPLRLVALVARRSTSPVVCATVEERDGAASRLHRTEECGGDGARREAASDGGGARRRPRWKTLAHRRRARHLLGPAPTSP